MIKGLGTEGLDVYGILSQCDKMNITFDQLLTYPEQDRLKNK